MQNTRKKAVISLVIISILAASVAGIGAKTNNRRKYDNVIVMVPDGCSQSIQTATRWYKGEPLTLDSMVTGTVSTYMANSIITGSAAAGTAFATGHKTSVRFLGVGPRTDDLLEGYTPTAEPYAPVASVLETAKLAGKATGLVATSRISHATPAAFACHIHDRGMDNEITENMVYEDVDVVFGGGFSYLIPSDTTYTTSFGDSWSGKRVDGQNLYEELLSRGYQVVDCEEDMMDLSRGKVWGMFDDSHMDPELDRELLHPTQPSLADMTAKAIEILDKDTDGFFLMVEGSQVDWAGHNNDPIYMITDFLEFDEAVQVAVDFAEQDKRTLVIVFPDHNTGGFTIGNYGEIGADYTTLTYDDFMGPLEGMTMTSVALAEMVDELTVSDLKSVISQYWGIDISTESAEDIIALELEVGLAYAIAYVVSDGYTAFGWTTFGHNGGDVPLWSYTADGNNRPIGLYDNTELAHVVVDAWGLSLEDAQEELFVCLSDVLEDDQWSVDTSNPDDPIVVIELEEGPLTINAGTDIAHRAAGYYTHLSGVVVYAPMTGEVYVPEDCMTYVNALGLAE